MSTSAGKRQRERQKLERAQAKAERKAAGHAAVPEPVDVSVRSESELIEELGALQLAFEANKLSLEEFEASRARLQSQFERLS